MTVNRMQFGFMPERGTIDTVFTLGRLQEECHAKGKDIYMFCGPRESFSQNSEECVVMGKEEEKNTKSFG